MRYQFVSEVFQWKIGKVEVNSFHHLIGGDKELLTNGWLNEGGIVACGKDSGGAVGFDGPEESCFELELANGMNGC